MQSSIGQKTRARQRGWIGLIVLLVGLVIVALLAKEALKNYGLVGGATVVKAGTPAERARAAGAIDLSAPDPGSAPVSPGSALERARGVEGMVKRQAEERASEIDGAAR